MHKKITAAEFSMLEKSRSISQRRTQPSFSAFAELKKLRVIPVVILHLEQGFPTRLNSAPVLAQLQKALTSETPSPLPP
jgi:hypothetical protein